MFDEARILSPNDKGRYVVAHTDLAQVFVLHIKTLLIAAAEVVFTLNSSFSVVNSLFLGTVHLHCSAQA